MDALYLNILIASPVGHTEGSGPHDPSCCQPTVSASLYFNLNESIF